MERLLKMNKQGYNAVNHGSPLCGPREPGVKRHNERCEKTNTSAEVEPKTGNNTESWCDVPGSPVITNPPADAGDTGSIPGHGRSHKPGNN